VIIGGLLTGAVDLYIEHRKSEAAIFKAKRLVGDELSTIWLHLDGLIDHGTAPLSDEQHRTKFMPTTAWDTYKETLAQKGATSEAEWTGLSSVLHAVNTLRFMVFEHEPKTQLPAPLLQQIREQRWLVAENYEGITGSPIPWEPSA
jgi:hypothetical protein